MIAKYLQERQILIINPKYSMKHITQNQIIMDLAYQFYQNHKNYKVLLNRVNKVRLRKGLYLPFELVWIDGGKPINTYYNKEEPSNIQWSFLKEEYHIKVITAEYKA